MQIWTIVSFKYAHISVFLFPFWRRYDYSALDDEIMRGELRVGEAQVGKYMSNENMLWFNGASLLQEYELWKFNYCPVIPLPCRLSIAVRVVS